MADPDDSDFARGARVASAWPILVGRLNAHPTPTLPPAGTVRLTILVPLLGVTIVDGRTTTTVTFNGIPLLDDSEVAAELRR